VDELVDGFEFIDALRPYPPAATVAAMMPDRSLRPARHVALIATALTIGFVLWLAGAIR
jgi:hypothetical protein